MSTTSHAPCPSRTDHIRSLPSPSKSKHNLSRSPKRAKSTPSPQYGYNQATPPTAGSSRLPHSRPRLLEGRRGLSFEGQPEQQVMSSPVRSAKGDSGMGRRRELSVPLLSQTLSHFSLSHTSPPITISASHHATPPTRTIHNSSSTSPLSTSTPQVSRRRITQATPFPQHSPHPHPSTVPLPHRSTLGSPFSSKVARGTYNYQDFRSPSRAARTEMMSGKGMFEKLEMEWPDLREAEEDGSEHRQQFSDDVSTVLPDFTSPLGRARRDTSGSSSSMDDFSGSGTSSGSLPSLGRSPSEQHTRPALVTIWPNSNIHDSIEFLEQHTPCRPPYLRNKSDEEALQMSIKTARASPLVGRKTRSLKTEKYVSPLHDFLLPRTSSETPTLHDGSPAITKVAQSPFSGFIPRSISTKKAHSSRASSRSPRLLQPEYDGDDAPTDTEDLDSKPSRVSSVQARVKFIEPSLGAGIGLGISRSSERSHPVSRSLSSESSGELDPSPSKAPIIRPTILADSSPSFLPARRRTVAYHTRPKIPMVAKTNTPIITGGAVFNHKPCRPLLRRGTTDPQSGDTPRSVPSHLHPNAEMHTPITALFGDEKPSPAAFASTGLMKKKSNTPAYDIPRFGGSEPPPRQHRPSSPVKSRLAMVDTVGSSTSSETATITTDGSVSVYVRGTQRTRGLRRKGSQMFGASGSSGSIGEIMRAEVSASPATPTKSGPGNPTVIGITTPSPSAHTKFAYPFASNASLSTVLSSPSSLIHTSEITPPTSLPTPASIKRPIGLAARLRGPVARASNPMLAESYQSGKINSLHGNKNPSSLATGRLERDHVILQCLGSGEFSQVWKVKEKKTGNVYACKAGKPYTGHKNRLRQLEEVSILRHLSLNPHPNIITFHSSFEYASRLYILTELARCGDLATYLLSQADLGGPGESRIWKILYELSSGLSFIHQANFVHLDIKPSNILITREGGLKIADFGMSVIKDGGVDGEGSCFGMSLSPALPVQGEDGSFVWGDQEMNSGMAVPVPSPLLDREVEGDREYLCPEALGDGKVGVEADVFSLGIMIMEAATNVVLPSNGEAWIKLRNDDLSDMDGHYRPRGTPETRDEDGAIISEISKELLTTIRGMMRSDATLRMTLVEIQQCSVMMRLEGVQSEGRLRAALVGEDYEFEREVLDGHEGR